MHVSVCAYGEELNPIFLLGYCLWVVQAGKAPLSLTAEPPALDPAASILDTGTDQAAKQETHYFPKISTEVVIITGFGLKGQKQATKKEQLEIKDQARAIQFTNSLKWDPKDSSD